MQTNEVVWRSSTEQAKAWSVWEQDLELLAVGDGDGDVAVSGSGVAAGQSAQILGEGGGDDSDAAEEDR